MGGIFQDTAGGTWKDTAGGTWKDTSGVGIGYIIREDGTGDFTSLVTALADPLIEDGYILEIQGEWENPDTGLVSGLAEVNNNSITIRAVGESRYSGYPVENPKHWRARKTNTANYSTVIELGEDKTGLILDGLDIGNSADYEGRSFRGVSCGYYDCIGTVTIKNSVIHRTGGAQNASIGIIIWKPNKSVLTLENTQMYGWDQCVFIRADVSQGGTVHINSSTLTGNKYGIIQDRFGHDTFKLFNSIVAGNATADISLTSSGGRTVDIHNSIDSDGTIEDYDVTAYGCLTATAVTDSDEPDDGDLVFKNITTLPYDLRLKSFPENCAYEMHSDSSGAGLTMPELDIEGNTRPLGTLYDCGSNETIEYTDDSSTPSRTGSITAQYFSATEYPEKDCFARARSRLLLEFQHSQILLEVLNAFVSEIQILMDVFRDIIIKRNPYHAGTDQLNMIGRIVGQMRTVVGYDAIEWFTPDKELHGPDFAPVWVKNAPLSGNLIADNEDYKSLIAAKIARNHTRYASAPEIQDFVRRAFGIEISFRVVDTMTIQVIVPDDTSYNTKELFMKMIPNDTTENVYFLPVAAGVKIADVITLSEYEESI